MANDSFKPTIDDMISGDRKRFSEMVSGGQGSMRTSRSVAGRLQYDTNMQLTAELVSGQMAAPSEIRTMAALTDFLSGNFESLLGLDDEGNPESGAGSGGGGGGGGSWGGDGPDRDPASNKSIPSGVKPVTAFGSRVVREILGFEGTIGGMRQGPGTSDHITGHAIDVMVGSNKEHGDQIADFFYHNRSALEVKYIIWYEKIASPRENWKWRFYDAKAALGRTDDTAKHKDHPHISFNNAPAPNINIPLYWPSGRRAYWPGQATTMPATDSNTRSSGRM